MTPSSEELTEFLALLSAAYKQCLQLCKFLSNINGAPHCFEILGRDLHDSYLILRTLYTLASDDEAPSHFINSAISGNMKTVLNGCLLVFVDVSTILAEHQASKSCSDQDWQEKSSANRKSELLLLHDNRTFI